MRDIQEQLTAAMARRQELQLAEDRAGQELDIATQKARKAHNLMEHRLALLFPDHDALVQSFFRSAGRGNTAVHDNAAPSNDGATSGAAQPAPANDAAPPTAAPVATAKPRSARRRRSA